MKISDRLKLLRAKLGLSQASLAKDLGINTSLVAHWETDRNNPSLDNLILLNQKYSLSVDWLLFGYGEMTGHGEVYQVDKVGQVGLENRISELQSDKEDLKNSKRYLEQLIDNLTDENIRLKQQLQTLGKADLTTARKK